jgi:putative photosynthetic complex assembly protein
MTDIRQDEITGIHKVPLYAALGVVVLSLVLVTTAVLTGKGRVERTIGQPALERSIRFKSEAAGHFSVIDAATNEKIQSYGSGEGAFIRTSIRSMTLNRTSKHVPPELPYRLIKSVDGSLILVDPETDHSIKLNAFGQVALTSFSQLFADDPSQNAGA